MSGSNLQQAHEEGTASQQEQQRVVAEACSGRPAQPQQEQRQHRQADENTTTSVLTGTGGPARSVSTNSNTRAGTRSLESNTRVSSCTNSKTASGSTSGPCSDTGRRTDSFNDCSSSSSIADYVSGARGAGADGGASPAASSVEWGLPRPMPLCVVQQQQAAEAASVHHVPIDQQQETPGGRQNHESGSSVYSIPNRDTRERRDTPASPQGSRSSSAVHEHEKTSPGSVADCSDLFLCMTSNASPASYTSARMADPVRGLLQGSSSSTHKRGRRDSSSSSSSCSEHDGCTGLTPLECSPSICATPHMLPASPAIPTSTGGTAADSSRLSQEDRGKERDRNEVSGAHLHAALLQRLCATPRRRKLSSSSSSAASDGQQTVASISSPAMLYAPLRAARGGPLQQQLQLQQDTLHAQPAQQPEPQGQLHQLHDLRVHESFEQTPRQLPQPEEPLAVSAVSEQEKQQVRQQLGQHSVRVSRTVTTEEVLIPQKEGGGLVVGHSGSRAACGSVRADSPVDLRLLLNDYDAQRAAVEAAAPKGATMQGKFSNSRSASSTGHQGATAYQSYEVASKAAEAAAPAQSGVRRAASVPTRTVATSDFPTYHEAATLPTVVSPAFPAGYSRDKALSMPEQELPHQNPPSLALMRRSDSLEQQRQHHPDASSAFATVSQMLQQHLGGRCARSVIDAGVDGGMSTCRGDVERNTNVRTTSMLEAVNQQSLAAPGAATRQPALYALARSDETILRRADAPSRPVGAPSAGSGTAGEHAAALQSRTAAGPAATDVVPSEPIGCLPSRIPSARDFVEPDVHEKAKAVCPAAAGTSAHLVEEREQDRGMDAEACSAAPLEHSRKFFKRLLQQFAEHRASSVPLATGPASAAACVSPYVGHCPQVCVASRREAPTSAEAITSPREAASLVRVKDGVRVLTEANQPRGAASAALLGTLAARDVTPSISRPLCDTQASASLNTRSSVVEVSVAADTRFGAAAAGATAVGGAAADDSSKGNHAAEAAKAEEERRRNSFGPSVFQEQDIQQLRVQQLLQALQEQRRRLGVMVEQTLARLMQTLDSVENNMLQTRLQRFQQQQQLLLQLQQRLENRSLPFHCHDPRPTPRLQQQQEHEQVGQQRERDQQETLQLHEQHRKLELSTEEGDGQGRIGRGRRTLPQDSGAGELIEDRFCGLQHTAGTGTKGETGQVALAGGTGEATAWMAATSAEARREMEKHSHCDGYLAGAPNTIVGDGREGPSFAKAALPEGVPQRYGGGAGREGGFVPWNSKKQDNTHLTTDAEDNVAALKKRQHQDDVAALMRVERKFLYRQQQRQQDIPLPEESASEMYWASLLQPTEMLLDRAVALTTSLIQPGVYIYLNKCFWESNQRDWTSNQAYPYSCSSSSCSSSVPCHVPRPAVDLLPVYYSSHCTPLQTIVNLPPAAAAAAAVAPSDADSILNFCFRVSLVRRRSKRQQLSDNRRTHRPVQRDQSPNQTSSSTTSSGNTPSNSSSDASGSKTDAGSRRACEGDGVASVSAGCKTDEAPSCVSAKEARNAGSFQSHASGSTTAQPFPGVTNDITREQAIQLLLPFPSNISPLQRASAETVAAAEFSAAGAAATKDTTTLTGVGGTRDPAKEACCGSTFVPAASDAGVALRAFSTVPVLPPLELEGPHPAWVLRATHAAAVAAKAALTAAGVSDRNNEEADKETDVFFSEEEEQREGLYASSVPVSLYGFSLSRRLSAAARDAAFNQIAAAAAAVAVGAASRGTAESTAAAQATSSPGGERRASPTASEQRVRTSADTDVSGCDTFNVSGGETLSTTATRTRGIAPEGQRGLPAADLGRCLSEQRRSSVSSTSSRDCRNCTSDADGTHRGEMRSTARRETLDRAWYEVYRNVLLRRDPPLRKAWVCTSNRRRGSSSDHRNIHWNRSGHVSGGGLSGYGSNSPSPFGVSWRPSSQRSSWGGGGWGGSAATGKEEAYFSLRDQQQSSSPSLDIHTQAEGIFVLRERDTGLPVAVRATVFCPDEENIRDESTATDATTTTTVTDTTPTGGSSAVGISSSSKSSRHSSPTRSLQQHGQARRGGAGSAAAAASGSSIQQGGQLLSKLFVVAAHATAAEEPMPVKLRRVKQMAKAWFRHKKLLALLLYWQRSEQQQRRTLETMQFQEQRIQHPTREGRKDGKKRATSEVAAAAGRAAEMHFHQDSGDEGTARQSAETHGVMEKEALAGLLKDEREEALYVSHLHFLGHALVSRFSSLVAAASLAWCSTSRAGAGNRNSRRQNSSDAEGVHSITRAETENNRTSVRWSTSTHEPAGDNSKRRRPGYSSRYDPDSTSTNTVSDTCGSSGSGEGALPSWDGSPLAEEGEKEKCRGAHGEKTTMDNRTSCWSLRIGLRWRESYFAFEYYVAAVYVPNEPHARPQQRQCQPHSHEGKHEHGKQEEQSLEQCKQKQGDDPEEEQHEQNQEQSRDDDKAEECPGDGRESRDSSKERSSGSYECYDSTGKHSAGASAVLLLDEMLQPCLCDITAVQHAFQAVVVRLLPFLCINNFMLRLLLEQSPELRNLSSSILRQWNREPARQWNRAPARAPERQCQPRTNRQEHQKQLQLQQEQQERERELKEQRLKEEEARSEVHDSLHLVDTAVIDEVAAAVETEERLQRSTAVAIATAFQESSRSTWGDALTLEMAENSLKRAGRDYGFLPLLLFDCLLQSWYPSEGGSDAAASPYSTAPFDSTAAALASAVSAASLPGVDQQQLDSASVRNGAAAVSLLLAARVWGAYMHDSRGIQSNSTTGKRTELLVKKSWFPFRLPGMKKERSCASRVRQLLVGTLSRGRNATTAATTRVCGSPPASAAVGSSVAVFGEDQTKASGSHREDAAAKEQSKKDPAALLEKQIKWISVRCSYIGVTDAPATSLKAALLLALLFPSQRQLLLEHLQLQDQQYRDKAPYVADARGVAGNTIIAPRISESKQPQGAGTFQSPQHVDKGELQREMRHPIQQKQLPQGAKQQGQPPDKGKDWLKKQHLQGQEPQLQEGSPEPHGDRDFVHPNTIQEGESRDAPDQEYLERVIVAAEMMLEGALEELWPGKDDEANAWQAFWSKNSTLPRENLEETRMLSTEIPSFVYNEALSDAAAEGAGGMQSTEKDSDRDVPAAAGESAVSRQKPAEEPHILIPVVEDQHQQTQQDFQKLRKYEQKFKKHEQGPVQQKQRHEQTAEQDRDPLAPQRTQNVKKEEDTPSLKNVTNASEGKEEGLRMWELQSFAPADAADGVAAVTEETSEFTSRRGENSDANLHSETNGDGSLQVSPGGAGRLRERPQRDDEADSQSDAVDILSKVDWQGGNGRLAPAADGEQQVRPTGQEQHDDGKTNRLKELLLLPVEFSDPANRREEGAASVVEGGEPIAGAITYQQTEANDHLEPAHEKKPQQQRHSLRFSRNKAKEDAQDENRRSDTAGETAGSRSRSAVGIAAGEGCSLIPSKGVLFFSAFPSSYSDGYTLPGGGALSDTCKMSFAPLWASNPRPLPSSGVAASLPWYSAAALRLAAIHLVSDGISEGMHRPFNDSRGMPIARGGADVCLLLRWCSSCLANSSSTKSNRSSIVRSSRSIRDSGRQVESVKKDISTGEGSSDVDDADTFRSSSKRAEPQECTSGYTTGFKDDSSGRAAVRLKGSWRDGAPEAMLDKLLLGCSNKRRPQQPPLWAGETDVSSLREGLDYRIDWRADWDIGDGHVDPPAAEKGASSSTVVDSSSSEEEETSAEEREARGSKDGNIFAGSTETEHAGRRAGAPAECYGDAASGVDETNVRQQEKKKSLRERLLSSATAGRATGGREQTQPPADGKQERVSEYFEELLVDQQLQDFLQGLLTTVRHARTVTIAPRSATQPPRATGSTSGRCLPTAGVYQEELFSASAFEVGATTSSGSESFPVQPMWTTDGAAPTWLFSLAAAEAAQRQLRAAETGLLPGTSPSTGVWSYLLLPATKAAPLAGGAASPSPVVSGRLPLRQQQEEAKKQQEESKTIAASALAAAAAVLREQQEGLRGRRGSSVAMPWTSLYLATATGAAAAAAATAARQAAAPPGCQTRQRAEASVPSSTCSTPRAPHHPTVAAHGVGSVSCRRGGGWRSVAASPSPPAATDAVPGAATATTGGSGPETDTSGRGGSNLFSAAGTAAESTGSSASTSAGGAVSQWAHATAGYLSSNTAYGAVGAAGGKPADSAATGPHPLASALLAALQQQPPPAHRLPHHFFPQHQRVSQQQQGPLCAASPFQQQQMQRRVSWEHEVRNPRSDSPSHSRRSSSSVRGAEAGSERSAEHLLESSRAIPSETAEALQQQQLADARRSLLSGRTLLHSDGGISPNRVAQADERGGSTTGVSAAGGIQQRLGEVLQRLPQQGSPQEGPSRRSQDLGIGDVQMEAMLQQLAAALLPSSSEANTPRNEEAVPTGAAGASDGGSGEWIEAAEQTAAARAQQAGVTSIYRSSLEEGGTAQGEWPVSTSTAGRQDEQLTTPLHLGSDRGPLGVPEAATDASRTEARQQKLQEVLRALAIAVEESEDRDNRHARGARTSAELQQLMAVKHCLEAAMEQAPFLEANRAGASGRAAAASDTGEGCVAVSAQGNRTPEAAGAGGPAENELDVNSLLYGQAGRGTGVSSGVQQHLQDAGTEGVGVTGGAGGVSLKHTHSLAGGDYTGAAEAVRRGVPTGTDLATLSLFTSAVTASAGRSVGEEGYGAPGGGTTPLTSEDGLGTAAGALNSAGGFTDSVAGGSPVKKKRSRYALTATATEASVPSAVVFGMGVQGHGDSRSPSTGHLAESSGGPSAAVSLTSGGRSRRSRRGSSSSRRSGKDLPGTPRGSSGAGLEMAAAAAAATAELSAREEAGVVTPRKSRNRSRWSGSLSPSPASRGAEAGGHREEGGGPPSPHLKQQAAAGAAGGGEDEMVPLGALPTGVYFDVARRLWRCQWREEGRLKSKGFSLGHYATLEEAREACILYKCAVSNIPLDPAWLVPEYLPASMASKRLLKHRQPSSLPPTSQENSPAAAGTDEPHSPLAAGSSIASAYTSVSCEKGLPSDVSRYGTPTTPRSASAGSSTDECSGTSQFLTPPTFTAGSGSAGAAGSFVGEPSTSSGSGTVVPCILRSPGSVTASCTESCFTQDSRRSGVTSGSPRRSSFDSDAAASFLSTESSKQPHRGHQQLYPGDCLLPMSPSSDTDTGNGQSSTSNRKRRRFASATAVASAAAAVGEEVGTDVSQVVAGSRSCGGEVRIASLLAPQDSGTTSVYGGDGAVSAFSASHASSGDVEHDAHERQRTPWLGGGVLSEAERLREEVVDDGEDESNWPSAAEVKEATAAVKAALSHEAPHCWSVGAAALHAATDALPAVAAGEGSLDVGGRRSTSQSPRRQLSLLTAAAAAFPFSETHEAGQYTFVENTESRRQHAGLVTEMQERFPRLQAQEMSQQRTSVSPQTCEQQGPSESEDEQRVRLVQLLRLVAGAASEDKSTQGASSSSKIPSSTP